MIPYSVVLVLVLGAHLVDFSDGQYNVDDFSGGPYGNVDWNAVLDLKAALQDGYLDHYDCTLMCFANVFKLSYINGDFCNGTFQLYSQDWSPVPFQKVVQVIECITVKCQTVVHKSVCDLSYDYPTDQYDPGSPSSALNNPNYQYPGAGYPNQPNSLISGTNPQAATQTVPGSDVDQLSQTGPQSVLQNAPNLGSTPQRSSDTPFSPPFPLSDIMKKHLTKYGYKIPKYPPTSNDGSVVTKTAKDTPATDAPTGDTTTTTTDSTTTTTTDATTPTTDSTTTSLQRKVQLQQWNTNNNNNGFNNINNGFKYYLPTTESTTPTTESTTTSTTESTTSSTPSTTTTPVSSTESTKTSGGSVTDAIDLLSDATAISSDNLNYPPYPAGYNFNDRRGPYYDYNGYPLGSPPGNNPYNFDNYYFYDYPYNDQQFLYNYRNPSYNPNQYTSKQVNVPGYQNQATGAQAGNLGYVNNRPAFNYNSGSQSQGILTPFSAKGFKNGQTPITQGIQGPDTNSNLGNAQGINQTPINQGDLGSSSSASANSKSQVNQAPNNAGVPDSSSFAFASSASQANQVPNNIRNGSPQLNQVPSNSGGFGSFAFANSASQINGVLNNFGVPLSNSLSFANAGSQINGAPNNLGVPGSNSFSSSNAVSQNNQAPNNFGAPGFNSFSSANAGSQVNQASNNFGAPGFNSYNFANSGSGVNTAQANLGPLGPNSYGNQLLNNQGLQGYQVPSNYFNQQNMPQNGNSLSDATLQSSSQGANQNPASSQQKNKIPIDNQFKIDYNGETYVLEKDGSISVYKDNVFVRKLSSPFK